ncbi:MAG: ABC transporter permease [Candidatus Solibacter sp.]|nr:ABC transporter permease [Candidatus Solibacter sp.]
MARLRFAWRSLAKAPLLSLVVILSVGLGIGANTAIFSLFHQILLNSLPVERPEELVTITSPGDFKGGRNSTNSSGGMDSIFSYPMFRELEKRPQGMSGIAAFRILEANLSFGKQTISGGMLVVSGGYFPTLGVRPLMGRMLSREDDAGAGNAVAVLSYGYWADRLGGESSVLNQPLRVNGQMFTVVGVTPKGFTGTTLGSEPDVYVPLVFKPLLTPNWDGTDRWSDYWLYLIGRPQRGFSRAQAQAALNSVYGGLLEQQSRLPRFYYQKQLDRFLHSRLTFKDGSHGQSEVRETSRTPLITLMCATVLVLLIAMANAANLLLARSAQRRREMAIRAAMGAGRGELIGQMLTEAVLLAAAGGIAGLAFAVVTLKLLINSLAGEAPIHFLEAQLEWPVLLFGLGLSLVTGVLFGLYPAWEAARSSSAATLKNESGQRAQGAGVRAGDGVGGIADSDGSVPEEHGEPDARGPGDEDGERDRVLGFAGAQRMQAGADARVVRAGGGGDGGHSRGQGCGGGPGAADRR